MSRMPRRAINLKDLRRELRMLPRGNLLIIAERAAELLSQAKLVTLVGDFVSLHDLTTPPWVQATLIEDVRTFHAAALAGQYYETIPIRLINTTAQSNGTDALIAEFDQLIRHCIRSARTAPPLEIREAFELLFDLLRHIDQGNDDIVFFIDEGGSGDIGVDWHAVLPVYFRSVAKTASASLFVEAVDQVITDFAHHERSQHLQTAYRLADTAQKAALRALIAKWLR